MRLLFIIILLIVTGCSTSPDSPQSPEKNKDTAQNQDKVTNTDDPNAGRYALKEDRAPDVVPDFSKVKSVTPHYEPYSRMGNKDYTLRGKRYHIIKDDTGFSETGYASWYGEKFNGHKTSNGETYDMFSMSAAHKTLPLPSFVKVTNTLNGKSIVVRVNDRGPFHDGRIIDLSMAAAAKLDIIRFGTAPVKINVIKISKPADQEEMKKSPIPHHYFVQLAAVSSMDKAKKLSDELKDQFNATIDIEKVENRSAYRVRIGPYLDHKDAVKILDKARAKQYPQAFIITAKR